MKAKQLPLFEEEKNFKPQSRGMIYTEKIWPTLTVHQKINVRSFLPDGVWYIKGKRYEHEPKASGPNYMIFDQFLFRGLDLMPYHKGIDLDHALTEFDNYTEPYNLIYPI